MSPIREPEPPPDTRPDPALVSPYPDPPRRGQRQRKTPVRYGFSAQSSADVSGLLSQVPDPSSSKEAMARTDSADWMTAMKKEMLSLIEKMSLILSPFPTARRLSGVAGRTARKHRTL